MEINSISNAKVKTWAKYHQKKYRDLDQQFLVEGQHLIEEAIKSKCLSCLLIRKGKHNPFTFDQEVYEVSDDVIKKLSQNISTVDYIGVCRKQIREFDEFTKIILLDDVQDPGNVGTIIRTAHSFGYDAVLLSEGCADIYNDKTIRSTQGALFHIPSYNVCLKEIIPVLQANGLTVYGTNLHEAKTLSSIPVSAKVALVFGNEGTGVSDATLALCNHNIKIEMHTFESLNVAIAAGICMYHFMDK